MISSLDTNLVSKVLNWDGFESKQKKFIKKKMKLDFFSIKISVKSLSPASGKENVRFLDSPDFESLPDFPTGRDVR